MKIPLDQFEQHFPESILKRGMDYFRKGKVVEVEETSPGIYTGLVEGTSCYEVRLHVQKGAITSAQCDCPYTDGILCKHMAAVVIFLQQDVLDIPPMRKRRGDKPTATPKAVSTKGKQKGSSRKDKQGAIEKNVLTEEARHADTRKKYEAIFRHLVKLMKTGREKLAGELAADFRKLMYTGPPC